MAFNEFRDMVSRREYVAFLNSIVKYGCWKISHQLLDPFAEVKWNRMANQCVIPKYAKITLPDKHCVVQGRRKTVVAKRPLPYVFVVTHKAKQAGDNNIT